MLSEFDLLLFFFGLHEALQALYAFLEDVCFASGTFYPDSKMVGSISFLHLQLLCLLLPHISLFNLLANHVFDHVPPVLHITPDAMVRDHGTQKNFAFRCYHVVDDLAALQDNTQQVVVDFLLMHE